ncbi:MAG: antitoxin [Oscillospiraceae bacterium]|nr:antitoxin [Oscillospiraceae bacterium]
MANDNPTYRAIEKYKKKTYDRIELLVYKGEKQKIKEYAERKGKTVNGFITELIRKEIEKEDS